MSPTALTNGSDRLELLLLTQKGPVNLALQDDELVVTRRKVGRLVSIDQSSVARQRAAEGDRTPTRRPSFEQALLALSRLPMVS